MAEPDSAAAAAVPQELGRKATFVLASQAIGGLFGFLSLLVIGRYFDPTSYGLFVFALSALSILPLLADGGYGAAHIHFVARGVGLPQALGIYARIRVGLTVLLVLLVVLGGFVWLGVLHKPISDATTLPIVLAVLAMQTVSSLRQVALDTWIGKERVNRSELTKSVDTFLAILLIAGTGLALAASQGRWTPAGPVAPWLARVLGIHGDWSAAKAGLALALAYLAAKAASLIPVAGWWASERLRLGPWDPALARQYTAYAIPVVLAGAAGILLSYTDIVMLGYLKTAQDVGEYAAGQKLASVGFLAATAVATPLLPRFSRLLRSGRGEEARTTLRDAERFLLLVSIPASVALIALTRPILHVAVGDRFLGAAGPIRFIAVTSIVATAMTPTNAKIMGSGLSRAVMVSTFLAVFMNATLNLWLIPDRGLGLGSTGAAIATLVSTLAGSVYMRQVLRRRFGVPFWNPVFARLFLAGIGTGLFWWGALRWAGSGAFDRFWELTLWGVAGTGVFALLSVALGMLGLDDLRAAWRVASPRALWRELRGRGG